MQKKSVRKILVSLMLSLALLLTACIPPGYTREAARNVKETHGVEARQWFTTNMPEATNITAKYYADGQNLYMAIYGDYTKGKRTYNYLYDYADEIMYLGELAEELETKTASKMSEGFGVEPQNAEIEILRHSFELTSANDEPEVGYGHALYGEKRSVSEPLFPYGSDLDALIDSAFNDEEPQFTFSVKAYVNEIPAYNPTKIRSIPGLAYISYYTPMDYEYEGINYAMYTPGKARLTFTHLDKAKNNVYIGYRIEDELAADDVGNVSGGNLIAEAEDTGLSYSVGDGSVFTIKSLPHGAELFFIAPKGKYYLGKTKNKITKFNGSLCTKCKYFDGYVVLDYKTIVPKKYGLRSYGDKTGMAPYTVTKKFSLSLRKGKL